MRGEQCDFRYRTGKSDDSSSAPFLFTNNAYSASSMRRGFGRRSAPMSPARLAMRRKMVLCHGLVGGGYDLSLLIRTHEQIPELGMDACW